MRLTLADFQRHDPQAPDRGRERRFLCPMPECAGKPKDAAHRTVSVNVETGEWTCYRCGGKGRLDDGKPRDDEPEARLRAAFRVTGEAPQPPAKEAQEWRKELRDVAPVTGTPGGEYLTRRGIPEDLARAAGVRFAASWYGRPAILFPLRDAKGTLVATAGRYVGDEKPKTRDAGEKKRGTFATPLAWEADPLVLVEGPIDALSLAACGVPAVALCGCSLSDGAAWGCALQRVAVALDADEAGDAASAKLMRELDARGSRVTRLRPADGKDWNDMLLSLGAEALSWEVSAALAAEVVAMGAAEVQPAPEYTPEEQAAFDAELGAMAASLPDGDLISWLKERFGCVLTLDAAGRLKAEGAESVPATVKAQVRGRGRVLEARLRRGQS